MFPFPILPTKKSKEVVFTTIFTFVLSSEKLAADFKTNQCDI